LKKKEKKIQVKTMVKKIKESGKIKDSGKVSDKSKIRAGGGDPPDDEFFRMRRNMKGTAPKGQITRNELAQSNLGIVQNDKLTPTAPVEAVKGIGKQKGLKLRNKGIETVADFLSEDNPTQPPEVAAEVAAELNTQPVVQTHSIPAKYRDHEFITSSELNKKLPTSKSSYVKEYIALYDDGDREWINVDSSDKEPLLDKLPIGQQIEFREGGSHNWNYTRRYLKTKYGWIQIGKKNNPSPHAKTRSALAQRYWSFVFNDEEIKDLSK